MNNELRRHVPDAGAEALVLLDADRTPLARPYEINLWETHDGLADSVQAPVDPADYNIDPLQHI